MGSRLETEQERLSESGQSRRVMAMGCDWTTSPAASRHQPAPLRPVLPAPSCQDQTQTKRTKIHPKRFHVHDNSMKMPRTCRNNCKIGFNAETDSSICLPILINMKSIKKQHSLEYMGIKDSTIATPMSRNHCSFDLRGKCGFFKSHLLQENSNSASFTWLISELNYS